MPIPSAAISPEDASALGLAHPIARLSYREAFLLEAAEDFRLAGADAAPAVSRASALAESLLASGSLDESAFAAVCSESSPAGRVGAYAFARELASLSAEAFARAQPAIFPDPSAPTHDLPPAILQNPAAYARPVLRPDLEETLARFAFGAFSLPERFLGFAIDHFKRSIVESLPKLSQTMAWLPVLTTSSKMVFAEAFTRSPKFSDSLRSAMINSLSDSDKFEPHSTASAPPRPRAPR